MNCSSDTLRSLPMRITSPPLASNFLSRLKAVVFFTRYNSCISAGHKYLLISVSRYTYGKKNLFKLFVRHIGEHFTELGKFALCELGCVPDLVIKTLWTHAETRRDFPKSLVVPLDDGLELLIIRHVCLSFRCIRCHLNRYTDNSVKRYTCQL